MEKIAIIIRVYNRVNDLEYNLDIIRKTWTHFEYYIIVSSNGESDGYFLTEKVLEKADIVVKCNNNSGHLSGNSELLLKAIPSIPFDNEFIVLLEADTWVYGDNLICKYVNKLKKNEAAVYAAAKWYDRYYSLATDFAIVRNSFLMNNRELFSFNDKAECHMANFVMTHGRKFIYIKENMLPHPPSYIRNYPYTQKGRIVCFPFSKMVTHHVELLKGGLEEKKRLFNAVSNCRFFQIDGNQTLWLERIKITISFLLTKLLFRRTWYSSTVRMPE